jgi:epoxyqueuosine reductase
LSRLSPQQYSERIRRISRELGFDYCGFARAEALEEESAKLDEWLGRGYQGSMSYLERNRDLRTDPRALVPGARSVISLLYNYKPAADLAGNGSYKVAKYAYGEDYHRVLRGLLKTLLQRIREEIGEVEGRGFVDSAPVMERQWAARGGLGWIGKNTLLLNRNLGSYFFIAELITDLELEYDGPIRDYCGTCTRCLDACPTEAFPQPGVLDASRCISYFTIELREAIPDGFEGRFDDWIFGCDICQDVCPWNRFARPHAQPRFEPKEALVVMSKKDWEELGDVTFRNYFGSSALMRTGLTGLKRNIAHVKKRPAEGGPDT